MAKEEAKIKEIEINGIVYVPKAAAASMAQTHDGLERVVVRTYSAGVHVGYLQKRDKDEVTLVNSRRIWQWKGANELCGLATLGILYPKESRLSPTVPKITILGAIEIIPLTEQAAKTIDACEDWVAS